ncbi:MAG: citrate/2-methylcitrate synthase [Spirochaetota bacterium]
MAEHDENIDHNHEFLEELSGRADARNRIPLELYSKYGVKRGLRNEDGSGVLVGLTEIGDVHGYIYDEGDRVPVEGRLTYRGFDIKDIVRGFEQERRTGYEEVVYLLLFGELPDRGQLEKFRRLLGSKRELPEGFTENMILKNPSSDIMNKLARSVLVSYSYDDNPDDISVRNVVRQSLELIARFPTMAAYGYQAKRHYYDEESLFIHRPQEELTTAENLLHMIRPDSSYTPLESATLDLALVLHAEHGGGNNSTFTIHVVSSSGTDTYSAVAAAVGSLKGPLHGGANKQVKAMLADIKANVKDWSDEKEVAAYLGRIVRKEAFDRTGLIYGIGHAVYTRSDPRAILLEKKSGELAREKSLEEEHNLYTMVARLAPVVLSEYKNTEMHVSPNVDFYSGFVYQMLNIPEELYTPIFCIARVAGWSAHRIEELVSGGRIIRPAYRNVYKHREYVPIDQR